MDLRIKTMNAILQMAVIKIRNGVIEPLPKLFYELRYSPDQPRGDDGRWVNSGGGGSGGSSSESIDKSKESGIINHKECYIHPDKVNKFFLNPSAKHFKDFIDVGYTENDGEKLSNDLKNSFDYSKAVEKKFCSNGVEKFSIFTDLGVTTKKRFRTVWQKDRSTSIPRIITAHREDG